MMIAAIVVAVLLALIGALLMIIGGPGLRDNSDGAIGLKASFFLGLALLVIAAAIVLTISIHPAHGAPPADADPALAPFFGSLTLNGVSCCSISDCRAVPARVGPHGWEARVIPGEFPLAEDDIWIEVPAEKIIRGKSHPHGLATMCWSPVRGVMCFTEPPGV